ncbi:MAG: RNA polymerase sigma factor [Colwellia sp.]|nr:RNA polymerase sigma factor [Colwellia sp.]
MTTNEKLSTVFVNYTKSIRRYISRFVNPNDIDDIVQETFIRSYEADLKQKIKYPKSYMLKTAKNIALNQNAKWDNKYNDSIEDFLEPPVELISTKFEDDFESKERFLLFCRATEQLSSKVRKCFILKKVYGLSQSEIAQYLNISESTVEKHVAKGLLKSVQYMQMSEFKSSTDTDSQSHNEQEKLIQRKRVNR